MGTEDAPALLETGEGRPRNPASRPGKRPEKTKRPGPIQVGISTWLGSLRPAPGPDVTRELLAASPRRWVVYRPMAMLPSGSFRSDGWQSLLGGVPAARRRDLWASVLVQISGRSGPGAELSHLAVNEGIPLERDDGQQGQQQQKQRDDDDGITNTLRSPSRLRILHGDFGPSALGGAGAGGPSREDFERAFWAETRQNGIYQTWAPRWTMFSRGNVKEKARLLDFHSSSAGGPPSPPPTTTTTHRPGGLEVASLAEQRQQQRRGRLPQVAEPRGEGLDQNCFAVDLYAGIGYFVFSYARLGLRLLCWELNPWSVEGLRRGAEGNGWSVKVVQGGELELPMSEIMASGETIVVFLEDNCQAEARIRERRQLAECEVRHVNCGFLPTSQPSWRAAWAISCGCRQAWLHLHENVAAADINARREQVQAFFDQLSRRDGDSRAVKVEKVELVKTFAPGIWHCVFDVYTVSLPVGQDSRRSDLLP